MLVVSAQAGSFQNLFLKNSFKLLEFFISGHELII